VIGEGVARELARDRTPEQLASPRNPQRLDVGDTFTLAERAWIVVGVMNSASSTFGSEIWAKRSLIGPLFGKDAVTTLVLQTRDEETAGQLKQYVNKQYQQAATAQLETDYYANLSETNRQFLWAIVVVTVVMAVGGAFGVMNTMFAAISQRIKDIGVLRLLGYGRGQIVVSFLMESLVIALAGGLAGCLLGSLAHGWSATSVVSGHAAGGKFVVLQLAVTAEVVTVGLLVSIVMGAVGGLVPALSAMRLRPLEALR
jgi:ABC-type antimicrobial peptide transport system permease subunit